MNVLSLSKDWVLDNLLKNNRERGKGNNYKNCFPNATKATQYIETMIVVIVGQINNERLQETVLMRITIIMIRTL